MKALKLTSLYLIIAAILGINYWTNDSLKGESLLLISGLMGFGFVLFYAVWPIFMKKGEDHVQNHSHR